MKIVRWFSLVLFALCSTMLSCSKTEESKPTIVVENVWSRPSMSGAHQGHHDMNATGVVYFTIRNDGQQPDRLLSVSSDVAHVIEIHETTMVDDKMTMSPLKEGVMIPAGASVNFEPQGKHIMLIGLLRDLKENESFEVILEFEIAGQLEAMAHIRLN